MKPPASIKVGPITYDIRLLDGLLDGERNIFGSITFRTETIDVESDMAPDEQRQTVLHEMVHIMLTHIGQRNHDEVLVDGLSYALFDVIRSNPELITYIMASDTGR